MGDLYAYARNSRFMRWPRALSPRTGNSQETHSWSWECAKKVWSKSQINIPVCLLLAWYVRFIRIYGDLVGQKTTGNIPYNGHFGYISIFGVCYARSRQKEQKTAKRTIGEKRNYRKYPKSRGNPSKSYFDKKIVEKPDTKGVSPLLGMSDKPDKGDKNGEMGRYRYNSEILVRRVRGVQSGHSGRNAQMHRKPTKSR